MKFVGKMICVLLIAALVAGMLMTVSAVEMDQNNVAMALDPQQQMEGKAQLLDFSQLPTTREAVNYSPLEVEIIVADIQAAMLARDGFLGYYYVPDDGSLTDEEIEDYLWEIFDLVPYAAMIHTGVPDQGDYIAAHYAGYVPENSGLAWQYHNDPVEGDIILIAYVYDFQYLTTADQEMAMDSLVEDALQEMALSGKSEYQKVQAIYEYITQNIAFDVMEDNLTSYTAYGALSGGKARNLGFASLFYRLALEAGLDARLIVGTAHNGVSTGDHIWNIVRIGDEYYNVDATVDANNVQYGGSYAYFLKSDESFSDYTRDPSLAGEDFYEMYPMAAEDYPIPAGTSINPIFLLDLSAPVEISANAGDRIYYQAYAHESCLTIENAEGVIVTVDGQAYTADEKGVLTVQFPASTSQGRPSPVAFDVTVSEAGEYVMTFGYPAGHMNNPAQLVIGENIAKIPEFCRGYYYTWTAGKAGNLVLHMDPDADWLYVVNNMTAGIYGDEQSTLNEDVLTNYTLAVAAGDEVQIIVNTTDPDNPWIAPEGEVVFTAEFDDPNAPEDPDEPADPAELFDIGYANMTLGNSLAMNFAFAQDNVDDWTGTYVQVVKTYADGRENKVVTIPNGEWSQVNIGGKAHWLAKFPGVAAKEMSDIVYVTVYNAQDEAISHVWEDSVRAYAMRLLGNSNTGLETQIMAVDLLNYGTAAQAYFHYNEEDPANSQLTASQKALATKEAKANDNRVSGWNYLGTNLGLESQILMRMAFTGTNTDMTAKIEFTNHAGRQISEIVPGSEFGASGVVVIDDVVIADGRVPVTVTVYNADGTVYASATDSMESYIARMSNADTLFEAILKFADSAYNFFH